MPTEYLCRACNEWGINDVQCQFCKKPLKNPDSREVQQAPNPQPWQAGQGVGGGQPLPQGQRLGGQRVGQPMPARQHFDDPAQAQPQPRPQAQGVGGPGQGQPPLPLRQGGGGQGAGQPWGGVPQGQPGGQFGQPRGGVPQGQPGSQFGQPRGGGPARTGRQGPTAFAQQFAIKLGAKTKAQEQRAAANQDLKDRLDRLSGIANGNDAKLKQDIAEGASKELSDMDDRTLKALGQNPAAAAAMIARLSCFKVVKVVGDKRILCPPPEQMEVLAKLYRVIELDPEFEDGDRTHRAAVLNALSGDEVEAMRNGWKTGAALGSDETKQNQLRSIQGVQTKILGFTAAMAFDELRTGVGGTCGGVDGKVVTISTAENANQDFDDALETVVHETTHAYQRALLQEITRPDGKVGLDDTRYAQAQLFKLNNEAYYDGPVAPPVRPTGEDATTESIEEYNRKRRQYDEQLEAYENQPVERHAIKAGNEAGRLFDANAHLPRNVKVLGAISRFLPARRDVVDAVFERIEQGVDRQQLTAAMLEIDSITQEAIPASEVRYHELVDELHKVGAWQEAVEMWDRLNEIWTGARHTPAERLDALGKLDDLENEFRAKIEQKKVEYSP
ncbi:MAG TPA: hypothetical protein VJY39_05215 [Acidisphaera sp.]|nr:hypothetical protein [Acidisphaera sp.]